MLETGDVPETGGVLGGQGRHVSGNLNEEEEPIIGVSEERGLWGQGTAKTKV